MSDAEDRARTPPSGSRRAAPVAPAGLYEKMKETPFAGRLTCSLDAAEAGSWREIVLDYEVGASGVADGATFKATFKFYSDWALFQTADPKGADYVSVEYQAGPLAPGQSPASVQHLSVRFDQKGHERPYQKAVIVDVIDGYLNMGDHIVIRLGDRRAGGPGTRVQTFVDDDFRFRAYVDPLGTSRFVAVPGDVSLRIVAGPPARLSLVGPRFARPGAPAPFRLSALDRWGNIVGDCPGRARVAIFADGEQIASRDIVFPDKGWASVASRIFRRIAAICRSSPSSTARAFPRRRRFSPSSAMRRRRAPSTPICMSMRMTRSARTARPTTPPSRAMSAASTCSATRPMIFRSPTPIGATASPR